MKQLIISMHFYKCLKYSPIILLAFFATFLQAQTVSIDIDPSNIKHESDSYIIGTNRNNVDEMVDWFNNAYGANYYENMIQQYADIQPRFGKEKKLYRLGGSNVDGLANGLYGGGYDFTQEFGKKGPYANDDIIHFIDEANALDADMIIGVNVGSGTPELAAELVRYFKNNNLLDKVAYFEMGNELMGFWQKGYQDGISCYAQMYADTVEVFIDSMRNIDPNIKIALCGSYVNSWEWPNCNNSGNAENINDIIPIFFNTIGDKMDYIAFHSYMPWAVIRDNNTSCITSQGGPMQSVDENYRARLVMAVNQWSIQNKLNSVNAMIEQYSNSLNINKDIRLVNTEFGTQISDASMKHTMVEALYTADNMVTALDLDIRSAINFCLFHYQSVVNGVRADLTDNIFFGSDGQGLKPVYYVHKLVAENMGDHVIDHNVTQNSQVNVLTCNQGFPFSYDKLGIVSTKDADGTIRTLIVNRSENAVTLNSNILGNGNYSSAVLKSLKANYFLDKPTNISSTNFNDLSNITIPKLSVNVLIASPTQSCSTGNIFSGCGVDVEVSGQTVSFVNTSNNGNLNIKVRKPNWSWWQQLCNDYNNTPTCNASASVTVPNNGTYIVDIQGAVSCTFSINVDGSGGSGGTDADNDGICSNEDCDDNDANIGAAQTPGTACDDGNPATNNDVIQADGCTCLGSGGCPTTLIDQCGISISITGLNVTLTNASGNSNYIIKVRKNNWSWVNEMCNDYNNNPSCSNGASVTVPSAGNYVVDIQGGSSCSKINISLTDCSNGNRLIAENTHSFETLAIYPNPANDNFNVKFNTEKTGILTIYNQVGKKVYSKQIQNSTNETMDVSSLSSGIYILELSSNFETFSRKFMVE